MSIFINIHTHHARHEPGLVEIENRYWPQADPTDSGPRSVGLHPWYLAEFRAEVAETWLLDQLARPGVVAVGESGLDKVCDTPWDVQVEAFRISVLVAQQSGQPLIVHCVRAHAEVLEYLKKWRFDPKKVVFHGFQKKWDTAKILLGAGCWLSFGAAILQPHALAAQVLAQTPSDRFFLETDASTATIEAVYRAAAALRHGDEAALQEIILANTKHLFGADSPIFAR